jgi:D-alanyl-D-alanine dipeptidase
VKREGDKRSPAGAFSLSGVYGNADASEMTDLAMPYIPLDTTVFCIDDPRSRYYNQIVGRDHVIERDWKSAERMRLSGPWYRWGIIVDHNANPRIPGDGSCIFLHVWGYAGEPTTGCTSFGEEDLVHLLRWLKPSAHPVLVQLPAEEYQRLRNAWLLP